ncbi:MAG: enolase C-terminal domain-like protein [Acidimicrobiales bacterium]
MKATLYRQAVALEQPVRASSQTHDIRTRLYLRIDHDGFFGFGEVSPQPHPLNGDPGLDEVIDALNGALTRLEQVVAREGALPPWSRTASLGAATPRDNVAYALVEMALLDRELRRDGEVITQLWTCASVTPVQRTVSILDDAPWLVGDDVARLRVKCAPGALSASAKGRLSGLRAPVLLDFNCSASEDGEVLDVVAAVSKVVDIDAVEQPFAVGNVVDHARLASRLDVELSLDESVRSVRDLAQIAHYGAASMVCVKPARVGGLANARTVIARAQDLGLRVYLGGFFESPYARRVNRALANSCVREPSDVSDVAVSADEAPSQITTSFGVEPSARVLEEAHALTVP